MYNDEEKLRGLSGLEIRELYNNAPKDKKALIAKIAAEKLIKLDDKETVYDTLSRLNLVVEHNNNPENEKVDVEYDKVFQSSMELFKKSKSDSEVSELAECMDLKALTSILIISADKISSKLNDDELDNIRKVDDVVTKKVEKALQSSNEISPATEELFYNAEKSGALDKVDDSAKNKFLQNLMAQTGWGNATDKSIMDADKMLADNVDSVELYIEKNGIVSLNPLFSECIDLIKKIDYEIPDGTAPDIAEKYKVSYTNQLMANALQRATQDVLRNPKLLGESNKKEDINEAFSKLIGHNFSRSVVVAGLATSPNTTNGITIDKNTGKAEYEDNDAVKNEIEEILNGKRKISPLAVNLDTHQLGIETSRTEAALKLNKVDKSKVPFWNRVKNVVGAAYNKIIKEGGWKKIALNSAMFMGAAAMTASGATGLILFGAGVYAGWTAANAWIAPAWDKLSAEIRQKKITGSKNKLAYCLNNLKRAIQEKCAEPGFKQRAIWRTVEGVAVGGVTAALGIGGAGGWIKSLVRQGTMITGKAASLTRSWFKKKSAAEKMAEQYSVANYKALQTAEGYLKQDKIALTAVVGGSLLGDAVKLGAEGNLNVASLKEQLSELSEKLKGNAEEVPANETPVTGADIKEANIEGTDNASPEAEATNAKEGAESKAGTPATENGTTPETGATHKTGTTPEEETPATGTTSAETPATTTKNIDINDLDNDHKKMFLNSHKKWENTDINKYIGRFEKEGYHVSGNFTGAEKGIVQEFYRAIQNGHVESCPEGMSPVEYVDKLTRLMQLAPGEQRKGIELMVRDLLCDDYIPSDADKQTIAEALNTIRYEKGTSQCVIYDENGNPCVKSMPNFGNYFGQRKVVDIQMENGETVTLPVRTANVTVALGAEVDCEGGTGKISSVYVTNKVDCGCDETEVQPRIEPEILPEKSANGENIEFGGQKEVVLPKEEVKVDMKDPSAVAAATKSGRGSYYSIDVETINGEVKRFDNGTLHIWDDNGNVVTEEGFEAIRTKKGTVLLSDVPRNLTQTINELPDVPTDVIEGENGSMTYLYKFEKGTSISVVLDAPKDGETVRVGHFMIGDQEVLIDKNSAGKLMTKMSNNTNMQFISTDGDEQNLMDNIVVPDKYKQEVTEYYTTKPEGLDNPVAPAEDADFVNQKVSVQPLSLTQEQKTQIMSNDTELTCVDVRDGKAILEVKGVEGVTHIAVAEPTHVGYNLSKYQPVATVGENGQYSVAITTADDKQMLVNIADGKATTTLDGKPVVLDSESSKATENMVKLALRQKNVNMNIDLHTDFTEKVVKAVEEMKAGNSNQNIIALNSAIEANQSTGKTLSGQNITHLSRRSSSSLVG